MDYRDVEATHEFVRGPARGADRRGERESLTAGEGLDAAFAVALGIVRDVITVRSARECRKYEPVGFDELLVCGHDERTGPDRWTLDAN